MADKYYAEIFNHSGASYHRAMQLFPTAREEEFNIAADLLKLKPTDKLLDVPAGGAYLQHYLAEGIVYQGLDFSTGFVGQADIKACSETHIPVVTNSIDKALCLAAMHHVQDKAGLINEFSRCLVSGGLLLIGDVIAETKEARFLNGFVDCWNSLGHDGDFINFDRDCSLLQSLGFATENVVKHYQWNFESEAQCHDYLRLLFALDKQPEKVELSNALDALGIKKTSSGFHLNWSLGFIVATWR